MTALTQSTKRKLSLLQLAEEIGNVSSKLRLAGTEVGPSGVRGVWSRHGIETRYKRLMRLEQHAQGDTIVLSETEIRTPRTNGFVERMNRTLLDECFRVQGRQT